MISVFIVDDEEPARDELKFLLEEMSGIRVAGMARNGREALQGIQELRPQVVFLDIQMPDMSGLAVARELLGLIGLNDFPLVVFATAFDRHALEAFEVNAVDYVLKPFSQERLQQTMERIKFSLERDSGTKIDRILALLEKPTARLAVEENGRIILLEPEEIISANISGRHVLVKTRDGEYSTGYSLAELQKRLNLLQTHKSYLVNPAMVREVIPWFNGTCNLVMKDREKSLVPVSRTFVKTVRNALEL